MNYSRSNPSQRYRDLMAQYRVMHGEGERFLGIPPEQTFSGISLLPHLQDIKRLILQTGAGSILDYGSGKGTQYLPQNIRQDGRQWDSVQDYWDVDYVHCYDPCYKPFSDLPAGKHDGVISTDVLEHCPEDDVPWILEEMFSYARKFVFATIACYPARKRLPSGENAHCTIKPLEWWGELFGTVSARHSGIVWEAKVSHIDPVRSEMVEQTLRGG